MSKELPDEPLPVDHPSDPQIAPLLHNVISQSADDDDEDVGGSDGAQGAEQSIAGRPISFAHLITGVDNLVLSNILSFIDNCRLIENAMAVSRRFCRATLDLSNPSSFYSSAINWHSAQGHAGVVRLLLQDERADPSASSNAPIRGASRNGHTSVVRLLLQDERVDPTVALREASRNGHLDIVRLLLQDERVDLSAYESRDFRWVCSAGQEELVALFLQDTRVDPSARDGEAIREACRRGNVGVVRLLLQDTRVNPSVLENEAIRMACRHGHTEVARLLLQDERVDPAARDNEAIREACRQGYVGVVRLLLQDTRVNPSTLDNEAIRMASANGHVEVVRMLLLQDERVDPAARDNETIREASKYGRADIVQLLLQDDRVNPADRDYEAMCIAIQNDHFAVVEHLRRDPRIDLVHSFHAACRRGYLKVVHWLLQDELVHQDVNQDIAYLTTIEHNQVHIVRFLLGDKRALAPTDLIFDNLLTWALMKGHMDVARILWNHEHRFKPALSKYSDIIDWARQHRHPGVIGAVLQDAAIDGHRSMVLEWASAQGHIELVHLIDLGCIALQSIRTSIELAIQHGHGKIALWIIGESRINPTYNNDIVLRLACEFGIVQVVRHVLQTMGIRPTDVTDEAFRKARENYHTDVVRELKANGIIDPVQANHEHDIEDQMLEQ